MQKKYRGITIIFITILSYTLLVSFTFSLQKAFILHPSKLDQNHVFEFPFNFEEVNLSLGDANVHAIHAFANEKPTDKLILYFHGNAGNLKRWGNYSEDFLSLGYDVLMIDYRGFGKSTGKASEMNMYEDAMAFYNYAKDLYPAENIVIYGRSIGTGVATELATKVIAKELILETPFFSIEDVINKRFPLLWVPGELHFKFENGKKFDNVTYPIHIFHGTKDRIVPIDSAQELEPLLKENDSFTIIPKAKHKNISNFSMYHDVLTTIL